MRCGLRPPRILRGTIFLLCFVSLRLAFLARTKMPDDLCPVAGYNIGLITHTFSNRVAGDGPT
jgi:hypothetical protein